jgi:hypothetical protein
MRLELPREWQEIHWNREMHATIQNGAGARIAVGKGAIVRCNAVTFWTDSPLKDKEESAAFIAIGSATPVPIARISWSSGDRIEWVIEV